MALQGDLKPKCIRRATFQIAPIMIRMNDITPLICKDCIEIHSLDGYQSHLSFDTYVVICLIFW